MSQPGSHEPADPTARTAGVSVQQEYVVECTECGDLGSAPTRSEADYIGRDHRDWHRKQGDRSQVFASHDDAWRWATAGAIRGTSQPPAGVRDVTVHPADQRPPVTVQVDGAPHPGWEHARGNDGRAVLVRWRQGTVQYEQWVHADTVTPRPEEG